MVRAKENAIWLARATRLSLSTGRGESRKMPLDLGKRSIGGGHPMMLDSRPPRFYSSAQCAKTKRSYCCVERVIEDVKDDDGFRLRLGSQLPLLPMQHESLNRRSTLPGPNLSIVR